MSGTAFIGNSASNGGGMISSWAILVGVLFQSNTSESSGGGLQTLNPVTMTDTRFISNTSGGYGGGASVQVSATVMRGQFQGNKALEAGGLFAYLGPLSLAGTQFISNTATHFGGGTYVYGGPTQFVNVLYDRNVAGARGTAIYVRDASPFRLIHATIASNGLVDNQAVYIEGGIVWLTNTIISNHTVGIERIGGSVVEDYSLFAGVAKPYSRTVTSGGHSITGTAAFVDPAANDYHLSANSDAINAGANAGIATDFEGQPRPFGAGFDIGYDEWVGAPRGYLPVARR
jgi:hypothetical protein